MSFKRTTFLHLSDFHHLARNFENHGLLISSFFTDLSRQIEQLKDADLYLAFTGDIVQSSDTKDAFNEVLSDLSDRLDKLGLPRSKRFIVPGNHDISTKKILAFEVEHEGIVGQKLDEQKFNDYVSNVPNILTPKFADYADFESDFADFGIGKTNFAGAGWDINGDVGVYCLNTSLCSSGGLKPPDRDKRKLSVDTRSLHQWLQTCTARWKVLLMHHPLDWLSETSEKELKTILRNNFSLCMTGHTHDQSVYHSQIDGGSLIQCSAPPLFTRKSAELGFSFVTIDSDIGVRNIVYRQWTKHHKFVSGVNFSNTDDGIVNILSRAIAVIPKIDQNDGFIERYFQKKLNSALIFFATQPMVWIDPILSVAPETSNTDSKDGRFDINGLILNPIAAVIKAPPQFGLTCLAHFLILEAWRSDSKNLWLYLDSAFLKPNAAAIEEAIASELALIARTPSDIKCVILDSWNEHDKNLGKILERLMTRFPKLPIICMATIDDNLFLEKSTLSSIDWKFLELFLWSLPRHGVREFVAKYNEITPIADEATVAAKIILDLSALNLHRTPINCLTLLKVSEIDFDESPVNRSEMIKRMLFLLFNVDSIPTYKARPDLKDCEYVLGYFCETMLKTENYTFSRDSFLRSLNKCCAERFIDLEVQVVFDVLLVNNILVQRGHYFNFKFTYWLFYFAAQRMHHDVAFAEFVFKDMRYSHHPEILEFYTGIDRRREDAVQVLIKDIRQVCETVQNKCGLPDDLNPYRLAEWKSSAATLERMQSEISDGVKESNLPAEIKDQYADRDYDRSKPYDQAIANVLSDYSFSAMMRITKAGARALRNSDYVNPEVKRELLRQILVSWELASKVLLVVLPILAYHGRATFDGSSILLRGKFGDTPQERAQTILSVIPSNITGWFQDDLFSHKMGPLLISAFAEEKSEFKKHELALLLVARRPRNWKNHISGYIVAVKKNSFYLLDIYRALRSEYKYCFCSSAILKDIEFLIRMAAAKHATGTKDPGIKLIEKIKGKIIKSGAEDVVPDRNI